MKQQMQANETKEQEVTQQSSKTIGQKIFGLLPKMDHHQIGTRLLKGPADTVDFFDVLDPRFRRDT